jgi:DNA polymerase-3 subunit delta
MGVRTRGFLGGGKVVWLRDANFLGTTEPGGTELAIEAVGRLTELIKSGLPEGQVLVISALKVDGRSSFYKACQADGEMHPFKTPEKAGELEQKARASAEQALGAEGLTADGDVVEAFLAKTGTDTRQIVQEAAKLATYLGDRRRATADDVEGVVSPSREALGWDLADAVGRRDLPLALRALRQLLFQGESAVGLVVTLEYRMRELLLYRECLDRRWLVLSVRGAWKEASWRDAPESEAFFSALPRDPRKVHPYRCRLLAEQAALHTAEELGAALKQTIAAHESLVSESAPDRLTLEFLLLKLLGRALEPAAAGSAAR